MSSFKPRGVVAGGATADRGGATAYLVVGIAKIQLPQSSLAGTWAELGNIMQRMTYAILNVK